MSLSGTDPFDPTPITRREIILGAGSSGGSSETRIVLIYGNKTSAGSESTDTIGDAIKDDADMVTRFGNRAEATWLYRMYRLIDTDATVFAIAPPEASGGTNGTCTFTIGVSEAATATTTSNVTIKWGGRVASFVVTAGDTTAAQATALVAALTSADEGSWPFTAAAGSTPNQHVVTVTAANVGERGTYVLTPLTVTPDQSTGNTITKSAVTNGSGVDDFTAAYAAANTAGEYYYQVSPKSTTSAATSTDNGIGEHVANLVTQTAPLTGKAQTVRFGLVGTNAQAITVATSVNSAFAKFVWQKNSPWTPGMLAAYHAAIERVAEVEHPAANINERVDSDETPYDVPPAYSKSDWASAAEIKASLNNGVCPVAFDAFGRPIYVRDVTSRSLNGTASDYRCREGHIPSAMFHTWGVLKQRYDDTKQPFIDDDLGPGKVPRPSTTYPTAVKALARAVVDDLTGPNPQGVYVGPILAPSQSDFMKSTFTVLRTTAGGGGFEFTGEWRVVEHRIKASFRLIETSPAQ